MHKFLITNIESYTGTIVATYDEDQQLSVVDMHDTNLTPAQRRGVLRGIPITIEELQAKEWTPTTSCIESTCVILFEDFWESFPNKVNKKRSEKIFNALSVAEKYAAFLGLKNYKKHLHYNQWKECKSPDTYLRNRNLEDEYK